MAHFIDPATAAHNIASAFCQREVHNMPDINFVPGDLEQSCPAVKDMWVLYSNVYDVVFDAASHENKLLTKEE